MTLALPTSPPCPPQFKSAQTLTESSETLANIIAFYESEKSWAIRAHSSLPSPPGSSSSWPEHPTTPVDTVMHPPSRSYSQRPSCTLHSPHLSRQSSSSSTSSSSSISSILSDEKPSDGGEEDSGGSSPAGSLDVSTPMGCSLLRQFEDLMAERMDSCRRVAQLVKEAGGL